MLVFPADAVLYDFIRGRVNPAIEGSPYIKLMIRETDNVGIKSFGKAFIYYRGSQTESKLKSVDADCMLYDEVDELSGSTLALGEKRLGHSKLKWQRATSTPTYPGDGIDALYEQSDQMQWFVKCEHCNERQALTFQDNVDLKTAEVICKKCRGKIDRLQIGEWVARFPDRTKRGYHINRLFCDRTDIAKLIENSQQTSQYEIKEFYNSDLGLPYAPKGNRIEKNVLRSCISPDYEMPCSGSDCVMGCDIGSLINVVIRQPSANNKAVWIGTVKDFEELDKLFKMYSVAACVVDANPETRKAKEFQERFRGKVYLAYYFGGDDKREQLYNVVHDDEDNVDKVTINRTQAGDNVVNNFQKRINVLPANAEYIQDYFNQVIAPIRVLEKDKNGNDYAAYREFGKADHYFHAEVYCFIALKLSQENNIIYYEGGDFVGNEREVGFGEDRASNNNDW